jgi:hypothetical protein
MLVVLNQRQSLSGTQRRHFAPFTDMRVDGRAIQDQRVGGGAAALPPKTVLGAAPPPLRAHCRVGGRSRVVRLGPRRRAMRGCVDPQLIPDGPHE